MHKNNIILIIPISILILTYSVIGIEASELRDIRFGQYDTFSRIVFDLYKNEPYHIEKDNGPYKMVINFPQIQHLPDKTIWSVKNNTVESVHIVSGLAGIQAEITLRRPGQVQKHFQLNAPYRVVVDIIGIPASEVPLSPASSSASQPLQSQSRTTATVDAAPEHLQRLSLSDAPTQSPVITTPRHRNESPKASASKHSNLMSAKQLLKKAELEWNAKQYDAAQLSYQMFLSRFPQYEQNHLIAIRLADILRDQKQYRMALDAYAKVGVLYPNTDGALVSKIRMVELYRRFPDLISTSADKSMKQYLPYTAPLQTLHHIVQDYPFHSLAHVARYTIGQIQLERNNISAALETFQHMLDYKLSDSLNLDVKNKLYKTLGKIIKEELSKKNFLACLRIFFNVKSNLGQYDVMHPDLIIPIAKSYDSLGLHDESEHLLQLLLDTGKLSPHDRQMTILQYARRLLKRGKSKEARAILSPLDQFSDEVMHRQARRLFGEAAIQDDQPDKAMPYLEPIEMQFGTASEQAQVYAQVAKVYEKQGQLEKSLKAYRKCVETSYDGRSKYLPIAESCLFHKGNLQVNQKLYQRAMMTYDLLLKSFPKTRYRDRVLFFQADIYRQIKDDHRMMESLNTLKNTASNPLWQRIAEEYLDEKTWKETFHRYLSKF